MCNLCDKLSCKCEILECTQLTNLRTDSQYVYTSYNFNIHEKYSPILSNINQTCYAKIDKPLNCIKAVTFGQKEHLFQIETKNKKFGKLTISIPNLNVSINLRMLYMTFIKIDINNVDLTKMLYTYFNRKITKTFDDKKRICTRDNNSQEFNESDFILKSNLINYTNEFHTGKSLPNYFKT